ncbi:MAG: type II toxin-antitoxin system VapC family toxin [Candidatus Latescibacteria bacterium]|nr:type II toxin-antitoxin system VapC family toxin [Candidatus Latescibacterota bacterium]
MNWEETGRISLWKPDRALLDTGLLIRYLRGTRAAIHLFKSLYSRDIALAISSVSAMEIYVGMRDDSEEVRETETFLSSFRILGVDRAVARKAASLIKRYPHLFGRGVARGAADALILATAWEANCTFYTLNTRHFASEKIPEVNIYAMDQNARVWI